MLSNNLKLNNGKTELLVLHPKYRPQPSVGVVSDGNTHVSPSDEARNLGAILDSTMGYERHITSTMPKKQIAQASLLRDMLLITVGYLAPQLTFNGVGSGVLTQKFNCNFSF